MYTMQWKKKHAWKLEIQWGGEGLGENVRICSTEKKLKKNRSYCQSLRVNQYSEGFVSWARNLQLISEFLLLLLKRDNLTARYI